MNLEEQIRRLKEKSEIAEKTCDTLLSIAFNFFAMAESERDITLKHRFYLWRGARFQHRGIGYHLNACKYRKQYCDLTDINL